MKKDYLGDYLDWLADTIGYILIFVSGFVIAYLMTLL